MGLFDVFKRKRSSSAGIVQFPAPAQSLPPSPSVLPPRVHLPQPAHGEWLPAGQSVEIAGLPVQGGMLYVGSHLPAPNGHGPDPALIDPRLPVNLHSPNWSAAGVGYWPSYSGLSAADRGAYLTWLAGGRQHPQAPITWVFLYFYGFERRALVDAARPGAARGDLPNIRAEVRRLLDIYGGNRSFRSYATEFLSTLDVLDPPAANAPPERGPDIWPIPMSLRLGLGEFAARGLPVPAEWALSWAHFHPEIHPRTPAQRCPQEFDRLLQHRYASRYGAGMVLRPNRTPIRHSYHAASAGLGTVEFNTNLPDVLQLSGPTNKLAALVEECTDALDAYSRLLGRRPESRGTLAATALLPPELIDGTDPEVSRLRTWIQQRLGGAEHAVVHGGDLTAFWPSATPGKFGKADAVALAQLLGALGVGVEPDVRLGGPTLGAGPAVLFRADPAQPVTPTAAYAAAATLLHLAAAVSAADGDSSESEHARMRTHLASSMHLSEPEQTRLRAHLEWLVADRPKLTGLTKRLDVLHDNQRSAVADFLITVATADGTVTPAEVTTLTKIFRLLALDPASVYSRIHAATTTTPPATAPVTVRPAGPGAPGYAIPAHPAPDETASGRPVPGGPAAGGPLRLDEAAVAAKLAETTAVAALLGAIFVDEDDRPAAAVMTGQAPATPPVAGLDTPHSALLRALVARRSWTRADFAARCAEHAVLPDGALDTLNEAAYDAVGDPLAEGDDPIDINHRVAQEMLA